MNKPRHQRSTSTTTATQHHHYHHRFSSDNGHKTVNWGLGMHGEQWEMAQTMQGTSFEPEVNVFFSLFVFF
jgi:hypothetical protein